MSGKLTDQTILIFYLTETKKEKILIVSIVIKVVNSSFFYMQIVKI